MKGKVKRYWTTDEVEEKLAQYRKELASLRSENERLKEERKWISVSERLPKRHTSVWCYNADGRQFVGRVCYGMHEPFFTYPDGDGNPSNTAPSWIKVTHWQPLPEVPSTP